MTSTTASISTQMSNGSSAMPTADLAPRPASPNTSMNSSEQPSITAGVRLNPGAVLTIPSTFTTRDDTIERADLVTQLGQELQAGEPGRGTSVVDGDGPALGEADLARDVGAVGVDGSRTGQEHQVPGAHGRVVHPGSGAGNGQFDPEFDEA